MDILSNNNYDTFKLAKLNFFKIYDNYLCCPLLRAYMVNPPNNLSYLSLTDVFFTPMRETQNRYENLKRFQLDNNSIWLTPTLSNCSIMFLKWPNQQYSMIHLRPVLGKIPKEFTQSRIRQLIMNFFYSNYKNNTNLAKEDSLLFECAKIIYNSSRGLFDLPIEYILIQSGYQKTEERLFINLIITKFMHRLNILIQEYNHTLCRYSINNLGYFAFSSICPYLYNNPTTSMIIQRLGC